MSGGACSGRAPRRTRSRRRHRSSPFRRRSAPTTSARPWAAGQRDFGENKVQEALQKIDQTADIRHTVASHRPPAVQQGEESGRSRFACIHSVDSVDLLQRLDAAAAERRARAGGADPGGSRRRDDQVRRAPSEDAERLCATGARRARAVRLAGLMLMPPWNEDQEQTRPWFVRLRELRDRLVDERRAAPLRCGISRWA